MKKDQRKPLLELANRYCCTPVAIVLNFPEEICQERNRKRVYRTVPSEVIHKMMENLHQSLHTLKDEGFKEVFIISSPSEIDQLKVEKR